MPIIIFGDSNSYGYNPATGSRYPNGGWVELLRQMTGWKFLNLGMPGRMVPSSPAFAIREIETVCADPLSSSIWIMLGDNDLVEGRSAADIGTRMKWFLSAALDAFSSGDIRLIAPPILEKGTWVEGPLIIAESVKLQSIYKEIAVELNIRFTATADWMIPMEFDGVHFTEDGHRIFAENVMTALRTEKMTC